MSLAAEIIGEVSTELAAKEHQRWCFDAMFTAFELLLRDAGRDIRKPLHAMMGTMCTDEAPRRG